MIRIDVGRRNYLLYLLLPHPLKMLLLAPGSLARLDRINRHFNETIYAGDGATAYDQIHRYAGEEQHEYPARHLVAEVWAPEGYGRALELGAGSGYFTALIARRATAVVAVEPVPDMQAVLNARCRAEGLHNVEVIPASAFELAEHLAPASVDSALVIQSLHHVHRRPEVFRILGGLVRPGGRLFLLEPHHNLRRAARLFRKYLTTYRVREFWTQERHWATHDFLTRRELRALCRAGGFEVVRIRGHWIPYLRRLVPDPGTRFRLESVLGRTPLLRHWASVLAVEAVRAPRPA